MLVRANGRVTFSNIRLNGKETNTQFKLDQVNNKLVLVNVIASNFDLSPFITFKNIDQDDTVTVTNCVAVAK